MLSGDHQDIPTRISARVVAILLVTAFSAILGTYFGALKLFQAQAVSVAESQHALYLRSLNEALRQHQHLPFILRENPVLVELTEQSEADELNAILAEFAGASGLEAIYLMSLEGDVVAASNYQTEGSFLGQNYGFRPYFQGAKAGDRSDYFAIGATTGRPGYFVAEPLLSGAGDVAGVVAIKLDVSELQAAWEERGEAVLATNADGIVVLSSDPDWLYRSTASIPESRLARIVESRQFGGQDLAPLPWEAGQTDRISLYDQSYFLVSGPTDVVDWTVHYLADEAAVTRQTLLTTGVLGLLIAVLIGVSVFLRSQRIQAALTVSQRQRRELIEVNAELLKAQDDLARSSKMAALGQLAASVTHELGQPISAFKNHLVAAEIGNEITSPETLTSLRRLADRMEGTTRQLRFFAKKRAEAWKPCDLAAVLEEAIALLRHDIEEAGVALTWEPPATACSVEGDTLQLEQAMTNLLRNAVLAAQENAAPAVEVALWAEGDAVAIQVKDNGGGLRGQDLDTLEEPFFSTRSSGDGMGLGLAITAEIIRTHAGTLTARDAATGGAVFEVRLPSLGRGS